MDDFSRLTEADGAGSGPRGGPRHAVDPARLRSPRRAAVAGVLVATLAAGITTEIAPRSTPPRPPAAGAAVEPTAQAGPDPRLALPRGGVTAAEARAAIADLLAARAAAVAAGDERAWSATVDASDTSAGRRQRQVFQRVRLLPVTRWVYEIVADPRAGGVASGAAGGCSVRDERSWSVGVRLHYRLGADGRDVRRERTLCVRSSPQGWRAVSDEPTGAARDLWDLGDVSVVTGASCLVIGVAGSRAQLRRYAADADASWKRVEQVWGASHPRRTVVLAPGDQHQLLAVLGRSSGNGLDQIAAVTTGEIERVPGARAASPTADRVVLNPATFDGLNEAERRVVLTHELTHVAARAAALVTAPIWVEEGFADYVAYRASGLRRPVIAADVLAAARRGTLPTDLPTAEDFDPSRGDVTAAYVESWLAMGLVEEWAGPGAAARFYRLASGIGDAGTPGAASADAALAAAFGAVLRTDEASFVRRWRTWLRHGAGPLPAEAVLR